MTEQDRVPPEDIPEEKPELEAVSRLLDDVAAEEASVLAAAEARADAPGQRAVRSTLEGHWRSMPESSRSRQGLRMTWVLVAAAAVILLFTLWRGSTSGPGPTGEILRTDIEGIQRPKGTVDEYDEVKWGYPAAPGRWFVVRVLDPSQTPPANELFESERVRVGSLSLPPEATEWSASIIVEVEVWDDSHDEPLVTLREIVTRRPR